MKAKVWEEMSSIIEDYVRPAALLELVRAFLDGKNQENGYWSQLTLYTHWMGGGSSESIYRLAALNELYMLALDVVDDLQDEDNEDKPWMKCPRGQTLNAILALLNCCYGELGRLRESEPFSIYPLLGEASRLIAGSIEGQHKDISYAVQTEEDYIAMVQQKSGSLIRFSCYLGLAGAQLSARSMEVMNELADCIGIIAQLENDIRDVSRVDWKNDLVSRKKTLPILYLLIYSDEDFPVLKQYYDGELTREQFLSHKEACLTFVEDSGCLEYARVIQSLYIERVHELFTMIEGKEEWKQKLQELTVGLPD